MQNGGESLSSGHAQRFAEAELIQQVTGNAGDGVGRLAIEAPGEQRNESTNGGGLSWDIRVYVHLAAVHFHPQEYRGLTLVYSIVPQLLLGLIPFGQRWQLLGVIQECLEPGGAISRLKAGNEGF